LSNSKNTRIEALERTFPLRVVRYRLREGSGGAGRFRGGDGIEHLAKRLPDECTLSLQGSPPRRGAGSPRTTSHGMPLADGTIVSSVSGSRRRRKSGTWSFATP